METFGYNTLLDKKIELIYKLFVRFMRITRCGVPLHQGFLPHLLISVKNYVKLTTVSYKFIKSMQTKRIKQPVNFVWW